MNRRSLKLWLMPALALLVLLAALVGSWVSSATEPERPPLAEAPPPLPPPAPPPPAPARQPPRPPPVVQAQPPPPSPVSPPSPSIPPLAPAGLASHGASVPVAAPPPGGSLPPPPVAVPPRASEEELEAPDPEGGPMSRWRYQPHPAQRQGAGGVPPARAVRSAQQSE